jgi:NADH-quinone oxidoreductase subunit J
MLTRKVAIDPDKSFNEDWIYAAGIAIVTFAGLVVIFRRWPGVAQLTTTPLPDQLDTLRLLGFALVSPDMYLLPFELASILLLAALIGAILLAWGRK